MNTDIQTPMECVSRQSETLRINEESDLIKKNEIQFQNQEQNDKIQVQNSDQLNENQEKGGEVQSDFQATQNYIQLIKRDQNGQNQRKKRNQLNIQSIQQRYQLKSPQFQRKFNNLGKNISQNWYQNKKKISDFPSSKDSQQNLYSEFSNIGASPQQEIRISENFENGRVFSELKKKKKDVNLFNCNNLIRDYSQRELNFSSPTKSAQFRGFKRKTSSKMWYSNQYRPFKLDVEVQRAMQKHIEKARIIGYVNKFKNILLRLYNQSEPKRFKSLKFRNYKILNDLSIFQKQKNIEKGKNNVKKKSILGFLDNKLGNVLKNQPFHPFRQINLVFQIIENIVIALNIFFFSWVCFFDYFQEFLLFYMCFFSLIVFAICIFLRVNTAYYDQGYVIYDRAKIVKKYRTKLLIYDFIPMIILIYYMLYMENSNFNKVIVFFYIFKYRIYQSNVEKIQDRANPSGNQVYYFSLSKLLCNSILICHVVGTLYFFLAVLEIKYDQEEQAWIKVYGIENASTFKQYSESFYWALATVSLIGSKGETTAETVYCIFVLSCTIGVFATILSKISMAWEQIEKKSRDYKLDREIINQFFKINNISNDLQGQLHNYLKHQYEGHSTQNVNNMFEQLVEKFPVELQELVKKERYDQQIRKISFLSKNFQNKTLEQISYLAQEEYFMPNQIIFQWEKPTAPKIYLVLQGEVQIYIQKQDKKSIIANLKQGEYFGHDTFFTNENPLYSARSNPNSFLTLLSISREDFLQVLKSHGNEEDFEKFHYFKDSILINGFCRQMDINCYICEDNTHRENNCNFLNYIPNKKIMLNRINYANCLEQDRFSYQRKYHQKFGLVKMQSLYAISQKIIYNPDLRKYLQVIQNYQKIWENQELNQTLDDIVSQMSSEISSDKYDSMQEYSYDYDGQEDNQQLISQFNQNQNKQKKQFLKDSQSSFSQIQSENSIEFNIRINMEQQDQVQKSQTKNNLIDSQTQIQNQSKIKKYDQKISSDNQNEIDSQKMDDIELSQQLLKQQMKNKKNSQQFNQRNQDQLKENQIAPQNKSETQDDILDLVEFYTNSVEIKNKIEQFIENKEEFQKFQTQSEIKMSSDMQSQIEKQHLMKDKDDFKNKNKSQNQNQKRIFNNQEEKIIENNEKVVNIFGNEKESTRNSKCSINQQDFQENSNNCLKRKESLIDKLDYLGNSRQKFIIKQGSLQNQNQNNQHFMSQTNCTYNRLGSNNQNNMMLISNFNQENDDNFNRSQENNKIKNQEQNEKQVKKLKQQQQQNKYQQVSPVQESNQSQIKSSVKESQITNEYDSLRKKKQSICNQRKQQQNNLQILNKNIEQIFEKKIRNSGQIPSLTSDERRNSVANNKRKQKKMRNRNKSYIQNSLKGEQQSEFEENFINNNIKQFNQNNGKNIQQRQSLNNNYINNGQKIKIQNKNNLQPGLQQVIKNPTLNQFYNSNQRQNSTQNQSQIQTYTSFQGDLKSRRNGQIPNNNNNIQGIQQSENLVINQVFSSLKEIQQILKKNMQCNEAKEEEFDRFIEDDVGNFMLKNNIDLGGINNFGEFEGILEFQILPDFDLMNRFQIYFPHNNYDEVIQDHKNYVIKQRNIKKSIQKQNFCRQYSNEKSKVLQSFNKSINQHYQFSYQI